MLKKVLVLCLCFLLVLSLGACKKDRFEEEETITPPPETSASEENSATEEGETGETTEKPVVDTSNDNLYPIKITSSQSLSAAELNKNFSDAALIHMQLSYNCVPVDWDLGPKAIKKDGSTNTYFRVSDKRFDSVEQLEKYLNQFFTKDCIKTFYKPENFIDYEGHLYAISGTGGDDTLLAGCVFKVTKQTTMRVFFTADVYTYKKIEDKPQNSEIFTEAPKDTSLFNIKSIEYVYEIAEDKQNWKFSKFGSII